MFKKILTILTLAMLLFLNSCGDDISKPEYDNPFDPINLDTGGDPFSLTAQIANGGVTLNWTEPPVEGLKSYKVYRSEQEMENYALIAQVQKGVLSYVDKDAENGHSYWYLITALNEEGKETSRTNSVPVNINTDPVLSINGGAQYTAERNVMLTIIAAGAKKMMVSNYADFDGATWQDFAAESRWILESGAEIKNVYLKVHYDSAESAPVQASISPREVSNTALEIAEGDTVTTLDVTLHIHADYAQSMILSNDSLFSEAEWEDYAETKVWHLNFPQDDSNRARVYIKFINDFEMLTTVISDEVYIKIPLGVKINGDAPYTPTRAVTLNIFSPLNYEMIIADNADINGAQWEPYSKTKAWTLPKGEGPFFVYAKFKSTQGIESRVYKDDILPQPINPSIELADGAQYAWTRDIEISLNASGSSLRMQVSEDSLFSGTEWQNYAQTMNFKLSTGAGNKRVYAKFINDFEIESAPVYDDILPEPLLPSIVINSGDKYSKSSVVDLSLQATASESKLQMKVSEDSLFNGVDWQPYSSIISNFTLSAGEGVKTVYYKALNDFEVESEVVNDEIIVDITPPQIALTVTPDSGITNETEFQFDPTGSSDNLSSFEDLLFRLDYENDDVYDTEWQALEAVNKVYDVGGGNKIVKMQLKDGAGWESDTTVTVFVNTRPLASFTYTVEKYKICHFNASSSNDYEDSNNLEYRWDFDGDGFWDTEWLSQDSVEYVYPDDGGDFSVTLSVRDSYLLTGNTAQQISVIPTVTDIDGNVYKVVKIGDQWWMAENLKVTHYRNGEPIPNITDSTVWAEYDRGAYCFYDNDTSNIQIYGILYNWYAVNDSRNLAIEGWHVSTNDDWKQLEISLGMTEEDADKCACRGTYADVGSKLKAESGWYDNGNGSNTSGFTGLPGGYRSEYNGTFSRIGKVGYWWHSTIYSSSSAKHRHLHYDYSCIECGPFNFGSGLSVRLVKD